MSGITDHESAPFRVYNNVRRDYCQVGRRGVSVGRETGRRIEVDECEVGVRERVGDEGICSM